MSSSGFIRGRSYVSKEEEELLEKRHAAAEFYRLHRIPEELERALNELFVRKPSDLHGYLAEFFLGLSRPPRISRVSGREVFDSRGQPSVEAQVYCTIRNQEKLMSTAAVSSHFGPKDSHSKDRGDHVTSALQWIQNWNEQLRDHSPCDQTQVDHILSSFYSARFLEQESLSSRKDNSSSSSVSNMAAPSPAPNNKKDKGKKSSAEKPLPPAEPPEPVLFGSVAVGSVSLAVAKAGAEAEGVPLYQHVAHLKNTQEPSQMQVPVCLVTLMSCGKYSPGKLNLFEEIILVPKAGQKVRQVVTMALELQKETVRIISASTKARASPVVMSDSGAPSLNLERVEQPLELISEACSNLGLSLGTDLHLGLSCAGPHLLDYSKGKYEVCAGVLKSPDEMVDLYNSLINKCPSVVALIDPLRREDVEQWEKLSASIGDSCSLLSDLTYRTQAPPPPGVRGHILKHFNHMTVSELIRVTTEQEGSVLMGPSYSEPSCEHSLPDLAVGLGLDLLKLGGLSGAERSGKYNRLVSIEEELEARGKLVSREKLPSLLFRLKPEQLQDEPPSDSS